MENVAIVNGHLEYLTAIGYTLWQFGTFCGHWVYFPPVLVCCTKKNLATLVSMKTNGLPRCSLCSDSGSKN
jgi:hypothetical protein